MAHEHSVDDDRRQTDATLYHYRDCTKYGRPMNYWKAHTDVVLQINIHFFFAFYNPWHTWKMYV